MKVIELVKREENDPLVHMIYESHKLVSRSINEGNPLCERFKDTRTPYEQYCSGEKYLKYDDETLYSRASHEFMLNNFRHTMYPSKNMRIDMEATDIGFEKFEEDFRVNPNTMFIISNDTKDKLIKIVIEDNVKITSNGNVIEIKRHLSSMEAEKLLNDILALLILASLILIISMLIYIIVQHAKEFWI